MTDPNFMHEDFLLESDRARQLYHDVARDLPIVDYHCHLPPAEIAQDKRWENLTQIWLYGDHYKWRTMRSNGIDERFCTGRASDWEKFQKFAETMPYLLRNPMYHWSHLEMKRYFGIEGVQLCPDTAQDIYRRANERIAQSDFTCRNLMRRSNVALVCTTDDPTDDLEHHRAIAADPDFAIPVLPTFRPDKAMACEDVEAFNDWVDMLAKKVDDDIETFDEFLDALKKRHDYFHAMGCRLSDHGLETACWEDYTGHEVESIFEKLRCRQKDLKPKQARIFKAAMLHEFGLMDYKKNWTQQYHFGAMRNNNTRMYEALGPDKGFDSIGDFEIGRAVSGLLDSLQCKGKLARTVLYNLNPRDNYLLATMLGNFQDGSVPGKMQFGSGWWFLDQIDGMTRQIEALSNCGLLRRFVGMLTDSRSFLSYTRHEYFRRLLCNILGAEMHRGLIPDDFGLLAGLVRDVCYNNAATYFGFDLPTA